MVGCALVNIKGALSVLDKWQIWCCLYALPLQSTTRLLLNKGDSLNDLHLFRRKGKTKLKTSGVSRLCQQLQSSNAFIISH